MWLRAHRKPSLHVESEGLESKVSSILKLQGRKCLCDFGSAVFTAYTKFGSNQMPPAEAGMKGFSPEADT